MNFISKIFIPLILITISMIRCQDSSVGQLNSAKSLSDSIKQIYAPDGRVAIFDVEISQTKAGIVIKGQSDQEAAMMALNEGLMSSNIDFKLDLTLLPDHSVGETEYAVVNISVANMRSKNRHSAELATQAIMGMVLKVLKLKGSWYLVQSPDDYIAWVDHGGVTLMNEAEVNAWIASQKVIMTSQFGNVYSDAECSIILSDFVLGGVLSVGTSLDNTYQVWLPDGREGYVLKTDANLYQDWRLNLKTSGDLIEAYAKGLMGIPYLWGGTSSKGMDCSGFTKTVYLMNGYVIPRDASQQIHAGVEVDADLKFEGLAKGDLMFFGKAATDSTRKRVTHVGIWLGNDEFIHASGRVKMGSINPDSPFYDEMNKNRYLGSRRYLDNIKGNIADLRLSASLP